METWKPAFSRKISNGSNCRLFFLKPWPGASQFAYSDAKGNTLTLQWVKEFYWVEFTIGVIITLIVVFAAYEALHQSPYTMNAYTPTTTTGTGTPGTTTTTPGQAAGGILSWIAKNWQVSVLVAGGLVATPFVVRHVAQAREAETGPVPYTHLTPPTTD